MHFARNGRSVRREILQPHEVRWGLQLRYPPRNRPVVVVLAVAANNKTARRVSDGQTADHRHGIVRTRHAYRSTEFQPRPNPSFWDFFVFNRQQHRRTWAFPSPNLTEAFLWLLWQNRYAADWSLLSNPIDQWFRVTATPFLYDSRYRFRVFNPTKRFIEIRFCPKFLHPRITYYAKFDGLTVS